MLILDYFIYGNILKENMYVHKIWFMNIIKNKVLNNKFLQDINRVGFKHNNNNKTRQNSKSFFYYSFNNKNVYFIVM